MQAESLKEKINFLRHHYGDQCLV